jgi:hypothetical protein
MNKFRSAILGGSGVVPSTPIVHSKSGGKAEGDRLVSVEIARDAGRSADHRDEDRHRLARETATIGYKGKKFEADLINLSGGGAMIEADISPRLWDRVDLYLGEGSPIECAVRWLRKNRIGLEFAHETRIECDADQRDALLLDVIRRSFPDLVATVPMVMPEPEPDLDAPAGAADASRRGETRHPLIWNGSILWQHDTHTVRLRNISASGASSTRRSISPRASSCSSTSATAGNISPPSAGSAAARPGWSSSARSTSPCSPPKSPRSRRSAGKSRAISTSRRARPRPGRANGNEPLSPTCATNSKASSSAND